MPRILQLPRTLVDQIAAGEVIERPASVVKELLENSIDAGSGRIEIDLEQGGVERIRVVDDGCGIDSEDLQLAFASHATSKLRSAEDLFRIGSLGFRGEALASIASVARVQMQSRPSDALTGAEIECNGGELSVVRPWNGAPGTRIDVRNLFFNTPVRKKFLKTTPTELGHICEVAIRLTLANSNLHLVLRHNDRLVHEIPATASLPDRIGLFFGKEVRNQLYEIENEAGQARLTGFIADPACDRGNAKLQYLFVNGRWIRDRSLGHAIQDAYRGLLMHGRYCVAFLFLTLPPDQVDVNVHPTKSEVRFRDGQSMFHLVRGAIRQRLSKQNLVPRLNVSAEPETNHSPPINGRIDPPLFADPPAAKPFAYTPAPWEKPPLVGSQARPDSGYSRPATPMAPAPPIAPVTNVAPPKVIEETDPESPPILEDVPIPEGPLNAIQIHDAYLVVETGEGMLVIDQHALHERILYEQLRTRVREGKLEVQRLLIPEPIDLPADQAAMIIESREPLLQLGLDVSDFGGGTVLLASYPTLLSRSSPAKILKGVVDLLISQERAPSKEQLFNNLLATMACKAAVKAGDHLSPEEINYLMDLRKLAEDSHHCPHGRPTSLVVSRRELDKQFKRT